LDPELDDLFQQELSRIEQENSHSTEWSQMFLQSKENSFLFEILRIGNPFTTLRVNHPILLAEALLRSPGRIVQAAAEWKEFTQENYLDKGLSVPNYSQFIEIQEALGLYGQSRLERFVRKIKRNGRKRWVVLIDKFQRWRKKQSQV
jgi:hypothetical protein